MREAARGGARRAGGDGVTAGAAARARARHDGGMRYLMSALLLVVACGGDDDGGPVPDGLVGRIEIEEGELGGIGETASIYASFEEPGGADLADDGTCRVYPWPCLGQVGACQGPPQYSAGPITIGGLRSAVTLVPNAQSHAYFSPAGLPDDLFADTASITVSAGGDQVDGFELAAGGVVPLRSPYVDQALGLVPGEDLRLTWTPDPGDARIRLKVNWADICHAGATWYVLECETADTGSFLVPAAITAALPGGNFQQCGARLSRVRTAAVAGRDVVLTVASSDFFGFL